MTTTGILTSSVTELPSNANGGSLPRQQMKILSSLANKSSNIFRAAAAGKGICIESCPPHTFLSSLPSPLNDYAGAALGKNCCPASTGNSEDGDHSATIPSATTRVDQLEILIRTHLLTLTSALLSASANNDEAMTEEAMEDLLSFHRSCIDLCIHILRFASSSKRGGNSTTAITNTDGKKGANCVALSDWYRGMDSMNLRKLPFILLEDTLDTLPIPHIQLFWKFGPSQWLQTLLCCTNSNDENNDGSSGLFQQGSKYCLIRVCNKLLKNLSVHSQEGAAEFAGRISMILAGVFPLSERSAVNVLGAFHVENVVAYETLDEWLQCSNLGEKQQQTNALKNSKTKVALNYEFYAAFWGVQHYFTDPQKLLPKAVSSTTEAQMKKQQQQQQQWSKNVDDFVNNVELVLAAFEGHEFSDDLVKHTKARWLNKKKSPIQYTSYLSKTNGGSDPMDIDSPQDNDENKNNNTMPPTLNETLRSSSTSSIRHYKYLTNSQLLHLQLQDPEIRIHFLTQLLIISSYLTSSICSFLSLSGQFITTAKPACNTALTNLSKLEKRAEELFRRTPPNGEMHIKTLKWLMAERESIWQQWKKSKCLPPIEQFLDPTKAQSTEKNTNNESSGSTAIAKRKMLMNKSLGSNRNVKKEVSLKDSTNLYSFNIDILKDLPKISRNLAQTHTPNISDYLEEYVEALDPEAGIEEEYHPKNDKLFLWRAMRLLARQYIGNFGEEEGEKKRMIRRNNGDFEGIVRKIWKEEKEVDIPGEMQEEEDGAFLYDTGDGDENDDVEDKIEEEEGIVEGVKDDDTRIMNINGVPGGEAKMESGMTKNGDLLQTSSGEVDEGESNVKEEPLDEVDPKVISNIDEKLQSREQVKNEVNDGTISRNESLSNISKNQHSVEQTAESQKSGDIKKSDNGDDKHVRKDVDSENTSSSVKVKSEDGPRKRKHEEHHDTEENYMKKPNIEKEDCNKDQYSDNKSRELKDGHANKDNFRVSSQSRAPSKMHDQHFSISRDDRRLAIQQNTFANRRNDEAQSIVGRDHGLSGRGSHSHGRRDDGRRNSPTPGPGHSTGIGSGPGPGPGHGRRPGNIEMRMPPNDNRSGGSIGGGERRFNDSHGIRRDMSQGGIIHPGTAPDGRDQMGMGRNRHNNRRGGGGNQGQRRHQGRR